ncbi:hypothetical protein NEOC95_001055 [Neochlamydia sp. AcF95]|nr:hypothetical protein [Neochlamydia sp. AcF95]
MNFWLSVCKARDVFFSSVDTLIPNRKICLAALELYLDKEDQFWIIAHMGSKSNDREPFFMKRFSRSSRLYELLKLMLNTDYTCIDFPALSHSLGELGIKNELKKVFFSKGKFFDSIAKLGAIDYPIDARRII